MYKTHKTYVRSSMKMSDMVNENYSLLMLLEHFGVDFAVGTKTVASICSEYDINLPLFLIISNLYNGFRPGADEINSLSDVRSII